MSEDHQPYSVEPLKPSENIAFRAACKLCNFKSDWYKNEQDLEQAYFKHLCKESKEWH